MPRRWGNNTRLWAYRFLVLRDGEQCSNPDCTKSPTAQNSELTIDHLDGDPENNDPDNLRLLCRSCNVAAENRARSARHFIARHARPSAKCVREREEGSPITRIVREDCGYRQGSPEMQANYVLEVAFRRWIMSQVNHNGGGYLKADAINEGAEVVGCSPTTTQRYLAKLTSKAGPLKEEKDALGHVILELKEQLRVQDFWDDPRGVGREHRRGSAHQEAAHQAGSPGFEADEIEPTNPGEHRPAQPILAGFDLRPGS